MSKFVISGDTHGTLDLDKVLEYFSENEEEYSKEDFLIILGDVGVCGYDPGEEKRTRENLRSLPVTTLFIDGNHENFAMLNSYEIDDWNGGKVHIVEDGIIHLMRGQVFDIDGTTFFTFGGASSADKEYRTEGISWFPEEMPNRQEYDEGWRNLEKRGFQVDYILSHTAPREVAAEIGYGEISDDEIELRRYLQRIADDTDFTAWYFGHFHEDAEIENFFCLFEDLAIL